MSRSREIHEGGMSGIFWARSRFLPEARWHSWVLSDNQGTPSAGFQSFAPRTAWPSVSLALSTAGLYSRFSATARPSPGSLLIEVRRTVHSYVRCVNKCLIFTSLKVEFFENNSWKIERLVSPTRKYRDFSVQKYGRTFWSHTLFYIFLNSKLGL